MLGYLEFEMKNNAKAYVEPSTIRMFITSPGGDAGTIGEPDAPLRIVLTNGGELDVYGTSIAEIMLRISALREHLKKGDAYGSFECGISFADATMSAVSRGLSQSTAPSDGPTA